MMHTYGPVYKHALFNLPPSQYRIDGGSCKVAEELATEHALGWQHQWLGADEKTIDTIGEFVAKLVNNAGELSKLS